MIYSEKVIDQMEVQIAEQLSEIDNLKDRIAELEGEVSHLKHINKNWSISEGLALQRIAELEKQVQSVTEQGENFWQQLCELKAEQEKQSKPVAWMNDSTPMGVFARHPEGAKNFNCTIPLYITPQTKPLSFDVMVELGKEVDAVWDVNINGSVWFPSVDAFESFCRAIEAKVRGEK